MPKPSPIDDLATSMAAELERDTEKLAGMLKPEIQQVGTEKMTKAEFVAHAYRNWNNLDYDKGVAFRPAMLKQLGNAGFIELSQDILKAHGHPPLPALMLQPPTINSGMAPPMLQPGGPRVG